MLIYNSLPGTIQDALVTGAGWKQRIRRYTPRFFELLDEYIQRDLLSAEEVVAFQQARLLTSLEQASRTPYYSRVFSQMGAHWSELCEKDQFCKIPFVSKNEIAASPSDFVPTGASSRRIKISTSGTTGQPFSFSVSRRADTELWAVWWRYRKRFDIEFGDKCALFSPSLVVPPGEKKRFWRYNQAYNEYRFSAHHISKSTAQQYVSALNMIGAPWIHGSPSSLVYLARLMLELNLNLAYQPRVITIGSENLLPWQKSTIEAAFSSVVVQHYGLMEGVSNISQCPHGALHVDEDFSLTEFIPTAESYLYSIVGTAFHNDAFTFLRYVTGDLARLQKPEDQCDCGLPGRVVAAIDGRSVDQLVLPNGARVGSLTRIFYGAVGLAEAQLYQDQSGSVVIRYVRSINWHDSNFELIEKNLRDRVGHDLPLAFEQVEAVQRTSRGKVKLIISEYDAAV